MFLPSEVLLGFLIFACNTCTIYITEPYILLNLSSLLLAGSHPYMPTPSNSSLNAFWELTQMQPRCVICSCALWMVCMPCSFVWGFCCKALSAFWEQNKNSAWFQQHPILSQQAAWHGLALYQFATFIPKIGCTLEDRSEGTDLSRCVPLSIHADDSKSHRRRSFCVCTLSSVLVGECSPFDARLLLYMAIWQTISDVWMRHGILLMHGFAGVSMSSNVESGQLLTRGGTTCLLEKVKLDNP